MNRLRLFGPAPSDERGSSLVLALALLSLLGIYGSMLLGYGWTSINQTVAVRSQRTASYAADGSLTAAIAVARGDLQAGRDPDLGGSCATVTLPDAVGGAVSVACTGQAGSGAVTPGVNSPNHAVLTFASGAEDGVSVLGSGTLALDGALFSNSGVGVASGAALDAGSYPVTARGTCTGSVSATPKSCEVGSASHPEAADPAYAPALTDVPTYQSVPACPGANQVVTLAPGFYDDAAALDVLTNGGCPGTLLWLSPGDYYFDFDLDIARQAIWTVGDATVNVVGGTPKGWSPPARTAVPAPGACKTNGDAAPDDGVQLVFGGGSRWAVTAGSVELCATPSSSGVAIPLFGLRTGDQADPVSTTTRAATIATTTGLPDATLFTSTANARVISETGGALSADAVIPTAVRPPLDVMTQPAAGAYGMRKLRTAYAGAALRVRRSSDSAQSDIGFDAWGNLDTSALLAFVGPRDGYVTTWYDQSGNGRNLVQATAARQGRIVIAGAVQRGVRFTGVSQSSMAPATTYGIGATSGWYYAGVLTPMATPVAGTATGSTGWYFWDRTTGTNALASLKVVSVSSQPRFCLQKRSDRATNIGCATSTTAVTVGTRRMLGLQREYRVAYRLWLNGTNEGSNTTGLTDSLTPPTLKLNAHATTGTAANAEYHELVVFPATLSTADRQTLEGNQAWYFGLQTSLPAAHPYRSTPPTRSRPASLTFSAFDAVTVPPGSVGITATLRVRHGEDVPTGAGITPDSSGGTIVSAPGTLPAGQTTTGRFDLGGRVVPGDGSAACTFTLPATARPGGATYADGSVDVTSCADTAAKRSGLTVRYDVTSTAGVQVTEHLDGIELDLDYQPPSLRAQNGCVALPGGCAWVDAGAAGRLLVQGTVYAPLARISLDLGGTRGASAVSRGVLLRSLAVRDPGTGTAAVIGLGALREVELVASIDGERRARALARFYDSPVAGHTLEVREWSVTR